PSKPTSRPGPLPRFRARPGLRRPSQTHRAGCGQGRPPTGGSPHPPADGCEKQVEIIVYLVCLHYARRAKYLTAFGTDPFGKFGWYNYRLDRIVSEQLTILKWGNSQIPKKSSKLWEKGKLPTVEYMEQELEKAWGFNFYLLQDLLVMIFESKFARWYVDDTLRNPTFKPIKYENLSKLVQKEIKNLQEKQQLLNIIKARYPQDAYYYGWIRNGDINVLMRLRDWRPKGEVIAPISIREKLKLEAEQELANYHR
ncbi:TIGR03985 family CRISPR-associated protein, partial [Okeania sp. SIO2B9]|uniref:TIGR03985 family CRISPR-associated protein n=1 Tax=Okeania sp. SIO2B9 TaxID=2607782 RepID=UPI00142A5BD1